MDDNAVQRHQPEKRLRYFVDWVAKSHEWQLIGDVDRYILKITRFQLCFPFFFLIGGEWQEHKLLLLSIACTLHLQSG